MPELLFIRRNGAKKGIKIQRPVDWATLIEIAEDKLKLQVDSVYDVDGWEVQEYAVVGDGDILIFAADGEAFIDPSTLPLAVPPAAPPVPPAAPPALQAAAALPPAALPPARAAPAARKVARRHGKESTASKGISKPAVCRLARRGGVKRIDATVANEAQQVNNKELRDILRDAAVVVKHAGSTRKTVTKSDVLYALSRNGRKFYG